MLIRREKIMIEIESLLQCPSCGSSLLRQEDGFMCSFCGKRFNKRMGVYDFLLSGRDQWEMVGKGFMNGQEEIEKRFFETPEEQLSPADQLIKAVALWYRGEFDEFKRLMQSSREAIYTEEYNRAMVQSVHHTVELIKKESGVVLDLATGMGGLLEELLTYTERDYLSADISPSSSFGLLQYLRYRGWGDRVYQIIAGGEKLPFKNDSLDLIVSAAGFQNMDNSREVFTESRRVSRKLITLCIFFEEDDPNLAYVKERNLHVSHLFVEGLEEAGWNVTVENVIKVRAEPTPQSMILGIRPDQLPVTATTMNFEIIVAE